MGSVLAVCQIFCVRHVRVWRRNAEFVRGLGNNRGLNMDSFAEGGLIEVEEEMSEVVVIQ